MCLIVKMSEATKRTKEPRSDTHRNYMVNERSFKVIINKAPCTQLSGVCVAVTPKRDTTMIHSKFRDVNWIFTKLSNTLVMDNQA